MDHHFQAHIIANDLDSMNVRIEALPAHADYTMAQTLVRQAKDFINKGRADLHQSEMKQRFAEMDARR